MAASNLLNIGMANADYLDSLYRQYQANRADADRWQALFDAIEGTETDQAASAVSFASTRELPAPIVLEVANLVHAYRELGHFVARLDPLGNPRPDHPLLALSEYGLNDGLLDQKVGNGGFLGRT